MAISIFENQSKQRNWLLQTEVYVIIGMGIILRAAKYIPGWSMRGDELAVTLNLINRSMINLISKPLDFEQAAPMGFLALEKILITLLGRSEYVLRLIPFLAGIASLFLIQRLLTKTVGKYGNLFAIAAFAFGNYLIYYSTELKQYSTDVLISIILIILFYDHINKETNQKDFFTLGIVGFLALFFSHPALFVLIAIGITLLIHHWNNKQRLFWVALIGTLWAVTFLAIYLVLLRYQTTSTYLIQFWGDLLSYMPIPPWKDPSWFFKAFDGLYFVVAGLSSGSLVIIPISTLGIWALFKHNQWQLAMLIIITVGLNLLASGFQKFPFHGRLILYLLPMIFILLGRGIDTLLDMIRNKIFANIFFAGIFILLLRPAIPTAISYLFTYSYLNDDMKPVLSFVEDHAQKGDTIYLYHYATRSFLYYAPTYHLENLTIIEGKDNFQNAKSYQKEITLLPRGQRIWFLFTFVGEAKTSKDTKQDERNYILNYLLENGTLVDEYFSTNDASSAHLFILK